MIRESTLADIPAILKLTRRVHEETHYREIPFSEERYTGVLRTMIASAQHVVLVAESGEDMVGFLLGTTSRHFFSGKLYATDLIVYAVPGSGHAGAGLILRFLEWARAKPGVAQIIMGISSDIVDEQKVSALYERAGLKRVGGLFMQNLKEKP